MLIFTLGVSLGSPDKYYSEKWCVNYCDDWCYTHTFIQYQKSTLSKEVFQMWPSGK